MPDHQRILVVSTAAGEAELRRVRDDAGRHPVVLAPATDQAQRVVRLLRAEERVEALLAPVSRPQVDRGHQLDALVRRHAVQDRYRDVVVVTDDVTASLLVRALAPDQQPTDGPVTVVGLPRGERPTATRRALVSGAVLGLVAGFAETFAPILTLPAAVGVLGLLLLLVAPWRHLGRELLLAAAIAAAVVVLVVASSARFPGAW